MRIIGIDPGVQILGLVALEKERGFPVRVLHEEAIKPKNVTGHLRHGVLVETLRQVLLHYQPDRVVIEGYVFNRHTPTAAIVLIEAGAVIRHHLYADGYSYFVVPPKQVKEYATGSGTAQKPAIRAAVKRRWDHDPKNSDCADAYVLAHMGLAHGGVVHPLTPREQEIIGTLTMTKA